MVKPSRELTNTSNKFHNRRQTKTSSVSKKKRARSIFDTYKITENIHFGKCSICRNIIKDSAFILSCLRPVCAACKDDVTEVRKHCRFCSENVFGNVREYSVFTNHRLASQVMKEIDKLVCKADGQEAFSYCFTCRLMMCDECESVHDVTNKSHEIMTLTDMAELPVKDWAANSNCSEHPGYSWTYCVRSGGNYDLKCVLCKTENKENESENRNTEELEIDPAYESEVKRLQMVSVRLAKRISELCSSLSCLHEKDPLKRKIANTFETFEEKIRERYQEVTEHAKSGDVSSDSEIKTKLAEGRDYGRRLFCTSKHDFLSVVPRVEKRLQSLLNTVDNPVTTRTMSVRNCNILEQRTQRLHSKIKYFGALMSKSKTGLRQQTRPSVFITKQPTSKKTRTNVQPNKPRKSSKYPDSAVKERRNNKPKLSVSTFIEQLSQTKKKQPTFKCVAVTLKGMSKFSSQARNKTKKTEEGQSSRERQNKKQSPDRVSPSSSSTSFNSRKPTRDSSRQVGEDDGLLNSTVIDKPAETNKPNKTKPSGKDKYDISLNRMQISDFLTKKTDNKEWIFKDKATKAPVRKGKKNEKRDADSNRVLPLQSRRMLIPSPQTKSEHSKNDVTDSSENLKLGQLVVKSLDVRKDKKREEDADSAKQPTRKTSMKRSQGKETSVPGVLKTNKENKDKQKKKAEEKKVTFRADQNSRGKSGNELLTKDGILNTESEEIIPQTSSTVSQVNKDFTWESDTNEQTLTNTDVTPSFVQEKPIFMMKDVQMEFSIGDVCNDSQIDKRNEDYSHVSESDLLYNIDDIDTGLKTATPDAKNSENDVFGPTETRENIISDDRNNPFHNEPNTAAGSENKTNEENSYDFNFFNTNAAAVVVADDDDEDVALNEMPLHYTPEMRWGYSADLETELRNAKLKEEEAEFNYLESEAKNAEIKEAERTDDFFRSKDDNEAEKREDESRDAGRSEPMFDANLGLYANSIRQLYAAEMKQSQEPSSKTESLLPESDTQPHSAESGNEAAGLAVDKTEERSPTHNTERQDTVNKAPETEETDEQAGTVDLFSIHADPTDQWIRNYLTQPNESKNKTERYSANTDKKEEQEHLHSEMIFSLDDLQEAKSDDKDKETKKDSDKFDIKPEIKSLFSSSPFGKFSDQAEPAELKDPSGQEGQSQKNKTLTENDVTGSSEGKSKSTSTISDPSDCHLQNEFETSAEEKDYRTPTHFQTSEQHSHKLPTHSDHFHSNEEQSSYITDCSDVVSQEDLQKSSEESKYKAAPSDEQVYLKDEPANFLINDEQLSIILSKLDSEESLDQSLETAPSSHTSNTQPSGTEKRAEDASSEVRDTPDKKRSDSEARSEETKTKLTSETDGTELLPEKNVKKRVTFVLGSDSCSDEDDCAAHGTKQKPEENKEDKSEEENVSQTSSDGEKQRAACLTSDGLTKECPDPGIPDKQDESSNTTEKNNTVEDQESAILNDSKGGVDVAAASNFFSNILNTLKRPIRSVKRKNSKDAESTETDTDKSSEHSDSEKIYAEKSSEDEDAIGSTGRLHEGRKHDPNSDRTIKSEPDEKREQEPESKAKTKTEPETDVKTKLNPEKESETPVDKKTNKKESADKSLKREASVSDSDKDDHVILAVVLHAVCGRSSEVARVQIFDREMSPVLPGLGELTGKVHCPNKQTGVVDVEYEKDHTISRLVFCPDVAGVHKLELSILGKQVSKQLEFSSFEEDVSRDALLVFTGDSSITIKCPRWTLDEGMLYKKYKITEEGILSNKSHKKDRTGTLKQFQGSMSTTPLTSETQYWEIFTDIALKNILHGANMLVEAAIADRDVIDNGYKVEGSNCAWGITLAFCKNHDAVCLRRWGSGVETEHTAFPLVNQKQETTVLHLGFLYMPEKYRLLVIDIGQDYLPFVIDGVKADEQQLWPTWGVYNPDLADVTMRIVSGDEIMIDSRRAKYLYDTLMEKKAEKTADTGNVISDMFSSFTKKFF